MTGAHHFGVNADPAVQAAAFLADPAVQAAAFLAAAGTVDLYVLDLEDDGSRPRMTDGCSSAASSGRGLPQPAPRSSSASRRRSARRVATMSHTSMSSTPA